MRRTMTEEEEEEEEEEEVAAVVIIIVLIRRSTIPSCEQVSLGSKREGVCVEWGGGGI